MDKKPREIVEGLLDKAVEAQVSSEAAVYTQAAVDAARALHILVEIELESNKP